MSVQVSAGKPEAEVAIDLNLVRALIEDQAPRFADLPITPLTEGWDNLIYRLGTELSIRLPRRRLGAEFIRHEQRWLPHLAAQLPIPVSAPVHIGVPGRGYPWHWSILPWFDGVCADEQPPAATETPAFARFLKALHQPAPPDAPVNVYRGVPISDRYESTVERLERLGTDPAATSRPLLRCWEAALAAEPGRESRWLHGDLHAQNVLIRDGRISAVIDWGDITGGDVATDLAGIWSLFPEREARRQVLELYAPDPATLARAQGWAFVFGVVLVDSGLINSPRHANQGRQLLKRLAEDVK